MANKGVDEGACACACTRTCRRLVCFEPFSTADAIVVSRYNETRHLRTPAALSKLASVVAHTLEAMSVARIARAATSLCTSCAATRSSHPCPSQNGTLSGDSSYQRTLFGVHYQMSRLEPVCVALSQEHHSLQQLKDSTSASIVATEADIHELQGQLKKRSRAKIYDGACDAASRFGCAADSLQQA